MLMKYRIPTKCRRFINIDVYSDHFQQTERQMGMVIMLVVTALILCFIWSCWKVAAEGSGLCGSDVVVKGQGTS